MMSEVLNDSAGLVQGVKPKHSEVSAKGVRGFFLYNPFKQRHFFRVYDPEDKRKFKDYDVLAEDIEVTIHGYGLALYEGEGRNKLDWSSKVLGK